MLELIIRSTAVKFPKDGLNLLKLKVTLPSAGELRDSVEFKVTVDGTAMAAEAAPKRAIPKASDLMGFFIEGRCLMV